MDSAEAIAKLTAYSDRHQTDIVIYNGRINEDGFEMLREDLEKNKSRRPNVLLVLVTFGGDPDPGFKIAKLIKRKYKKFTVAVFGMCKSTGTLIALAADDIVFSDSGELGPLDIQIRKHDELFLRSSGLDVFQAVAAVSKSAFQSFEEYFLTVLEKSEFALSTKTAAEIASSLATGIFSPIASQLNPLSLGETHRALKVADKYGALLAGKNAKPDALETLIYKYPSHGFVIDIEQAQGLFYSVTQAQGEISEIDEILRPLTRQVVDKQTIATLCPYHENNTTSGSAPDSQKEPNSRPSDNTPDARSGAHGSTSQQPREQAEACASAIPQPNGSPSDRLEGS